MRLFMCVIRSLAVLVHMGMRPRSDVIAYFAELFRGKLEKEYSHVWDVLVSEAVDLYAKTLVDDISGAYEAGLLPVDCLEVMNSNQN
jgi:hypothetical protein